MRVYLETIKILLEKRSDMMILQDWLVVVDDGQVWGWLDVEVVGGPGVVVVVDDGGEQQGEDLEVGHPVLQPGLGDDPVRGLQHVAGVQVVVVRVAVTENRVVTRFKDLRNIFKPLT